jgi:hypothetical protein
MASAAAPSLAEQCYWIPSRSYLRSSVSFSRDLKVGLKSAAPVFRMGILPFCSPEGTQWGEIG